MSEACTSERALLTSEPPDPAWRLVREALRDLQFGTVTLIVQDGLVIQVDRTEKRRIRRESRRP